MKNPCILALTLASALLLVVTTPDGLAAKKEKAAPPAKPAVGDTLAIAFKAVDGTKVDLSAMKDKVVLVDFWATWCGPCVGEIPNVKAVYDKYHGSGFEVIGISLDNDKSALKKFVKKNALPWPQSCSGDGWDDDLAKKYGISSIPAMFLIGKDGKVAEVNLRGPGVLEKKVGGLIAK